jgi:hypothetical protein
MSPTWRPSIYVGTTGNSTAAGKEREKLNLPISKYQLPVSEWAHSEGRTIRVIPSDSVQRIWRSASAKAAVAFASYLQRN